MSIERCRRHDHSYDTDFELCCPHCDTTYDSDFADSFEDDVAIAESMFQPVEIKEPQS